MNTQLCVTPGLHCCERHARHSACANANTHTHIPCMRACMVLMSIPSICTQFAVWTSRMGAHQFQVLARSSSMHRCCRRGATRLVGTTRLVGATRLKQHSGIECTVCILSVEGVYRSRCLHRIQESWVVPWFIDLCDEIIVCYVCWGRLPTDTQ